MAQASVLSAIVLSKNKESDPVDQQPQNNPNSLPFYKQGAFVVTLLFMPIIYFIVGVVLWPANNYSAELKAAVITTGLISTVAAVLSFWMAGSHGSKPNPDVDTAALPTTSTTSTTISTTQPKDPT
jgi:hypothetical protein